MPEQGLSQFWKESVGAFSAHRQAHVNTSRVVDRVTVWEIFLLIFSQDLNLFFVPVCVNEAQCCVSNKQISVCVLPSEHILAEGFPKGSVNLSREHGLRKKGGVKMRLEF